MQGQGLELAAGGHELTYTYDAQRNSGTGIAELLQSLNAQGIAFKDLHTSESSLEDIFVSLVHQPRPAAEARPSA
jgi:ABC-2 type transport system ATP-binding protein